MIVVADTSPLNYLILIGEPNLLYRLYGRTVIPRAVLSELQASGAPLGEIRSSEGWNQVTGGVSANCRGSSERGRGAEWRIE
jgi:predicted nucleic acid-binding protein